jgi:hypothetical protein
LKILSNMIKNLDAPMIGVYTTMAAVAMFFATVAVLPIPEGVVFQPPRFQDHPQFGAVASRDHFGPHATLR